MENSPNCIYTHPTGSIHHVGGAKPLQQSVLPRELHPAPMNAEGLQLLQLVHRVAERYVWGEAPEYHITLTSGLSGA